MTGRGQETIESRYLQSCDIPAEESRIEPFTMLIFGGAGDLSRRKLMPALFRLYQAGVLPDLFAVIGFGRTKMSDNEFRSIMKVALLGSGEQSFNETSWDSFSQHLYYIAGHIGDDATVKSMCDKVDQIAIKTEKGRKDIIYYMAVPPETTPEIVQRLKENALCRGSKIIVEKPFGIDFGTAHELNTILRDAFEESQIYRIDHYLGKEPVQNIIFFRFTNTIFERLWNGRYIDNVQITVAEDIGIDHRAEFYENTGVVRDIVQNHIMQLIGVIAMEPPIGFKADFIRDEKIKVIRSMRPIDVSYIDRFMVRGQYGKGVIDGNSVRGYREEDKVSPNSTVPTFFAGKFYIDNLRWASVPFYVRAGKRMKKSITEICLQFRQLPLRLFGRTCDIVEPNALVLTIQPEEKISLRFCVKYPYASNQIHIEDLVFNYNDAFKQGLSDAYDKLIVDCMKGDQTLFVREDMVETMWDVVDPIIKRWDEVPPSQFPNYEAGTWGPEAAAQLMAQAGHRWITG